MIISCCHPRGWAHPQNRLTGIRHCADPIPGRRQGRSVSRVSTHAPTAVLGYVPLTLTHNRPREATEQAIDAA